MLGRALGWVVGVSLLLLLITPFVHQLWTHYIYVKELYQLSDPVARAALNERYGSIGGFADDVATRCRQLYGTDQPGCLNYLRNLK